MPSATTLEVLERTVDDTARNKRVTSRGEKVMRGARTAVCNVCKLAPGLEQVEVIMTSDRRPSWNLWMCMRIFQG